MLRRLLFLLLVLHCPSIAVKAQILNDKLATKQSVQVLDYIYNLDIPQANRLINTIKQKYPNHPAISFMKGLVLYWSYLPLTKSSQKFPVFDKLMDETIARAEVILKKNSKDLEGIMFKMLGLSLKSVLEAEEGTFLKSVNLGKKAFYYMKKGFDKTAQYPDFYFSTGLYRYYAEQYPKTNPIAVPFMIFFPYGSKQEGLDYLVKASKYSTFSKAEAMVYLCQIYAKFEKNYYLATFYAQQLTNKYPGNPFFWLKYTEYLLWQGKYQYAKNIMYKFENQDSKAFKIAINTLKGWLNEKYYKNYTIAEASYKKALIYKKYDARYSLDYVTIAYNGLARIAHIKGNYVLAKTYYKKSLALAQYEAVKEEANKYLKKKH